MDWLSDSEGESEEEIPLRALIPTPYLSNLERRGNLRGLTAERIQKFQHFAADESLVGERCLVCMNDLIIGMQMVRLDCHVNHILCKTCAEKWFKDHKTCPNCRHEFN